MQITAYCFFLYDSLFTDWQLTLPDDRAPSEVWKWVSEDESIDITIFPHFTFREKWEESWVSDNSHFTRRESEESFGITASPVYFAIHVSLTAEGPKMVKLSIMR